MKSIIFTLLNYIYTSLVLLSVHGYQSNISITQHQALDFFTSLNPEAKKDAFVEDWMDLHEEDESIKINDVVELVSKSHCLTIFLKDLKEKIIQQFISLNGYIRIQRRITYYNHLFDEGIFKQPPKESFSSKLKRLIITRKPPPYYTNYRSENTDYIKICGDLISCLRKDFGYCKRPETYANPMLFSKTFSLNSRISQSTPKDVQISIDE